MWFLRHFIPIFILVAIIACCPERDNPLDPRSPQYTGEATVKGTVGNFVGSPIQNASVTAHRLSSQHSVACVTDEDGKFILYVDEGDYDVIAAKDGYTESCERISIDAGEEDVISFSINGIPFVSQQLAISGRMATWMGSVVEITVTAQVDDPDGPQDIDSVDVTVDGMEKELDFNPESQMYEYRICESECPYGNPELLVGMPFVITAVDGKQAEGISDKFYLVRIFPGFPLPISPADGDTVEAEGFQLVWHRLKTNFPMSYLVQIFVGWPPQVVWQKNTQDTVSSVDIAFSEGEYHYWIKAQDEYGNTSRSMAKRFYVD